MPVISKITGAPFRFWCQKVLPAVYDDSLSYYELLCKVVDYLNKVMEDDINVVNLVNELEEFVNNYFNNLDVQEEINNKLDAMAEDGSLIGIIAPHLDPIIEDYESQLDEDLAEYKETMDADVADFKSTVNDAIDAQDTDIANFKSTVNGQVSAQNSEIANFKSTVNTTVEVQDNDISVMQSQMSNFINSYSDIQTFTDLYTATATNGLHYINQTIDLSNPYTDYEELDIYWSYNSDKKVIRVKSADLLANGAYLSWYVDKSPDTGIPAPMYIALMKLMNGNGTHTQLTLGEAYSEEWNGLSASDATRDKATTASDYTAGEVYKIVGVTYTTSAELTDIRVGSNGTVYPTAGDAVRGQASILQESIDKHSNIISTNLMGIDVQENLYPGAADWSGTWLNNDPNHLGLSEETFEGYSTYYSSQGWRKIRKHIPIEAGKTYTFEAWLKPTAPATAYLYLKDTDTIGPATISASSTYINNAVANKWIKLSITFTCTISGNISPYGYCTQAYYVAKYMLVEGSTVFSLENALEDKATKQQVSGIGDYQRYSFTLGSSLGRWMNHTFDKTLSQGDKVRLIFDSYSGSSVLESLNLFGKKQDATFELFASIQNPMHGDITEAYALNDYTALRIQYVRVTDESNVTGISLIATNHMLGIADDILSIYNPRVYHVEKDGTGDFTTFLDGINEACKYMDSVVYVGAGEYDLLDELGSDYIQNPSSDKKGIVLKNRVHVICSSQTVLKMNNTGATLEYISPINTGEYGCTLENATIVDNGVRYSIHDDRGWSGSIPYTNKFINCTLIHKNGTYGDCIGGGLGENCEIEIRGCYLEGDSNIQRLAYYHGNNHTGITNAKGRITVCENYFAGVGSFWVQKYGDSTEMTTAYVSNNSFGTSPQVTAGENAQDNMRMIAWNNEVRS